MLKIVVKTSIIFVALLLVASLSYSAYLLLSYSRLPDNMSLETRGVHDKEKVSCGTSYTIVSANLGFGAYSQDFSFFMDGGKYSWAYSKDEVVKNITGSVNSLIKFKPDFFLFQEVDFDATRSRHVDERNLISETLKESMGKTNTVFAQNYDSAFLFWPLTQPHGANKSGIMVATEYKAYDSMRRSFPIETGLSKFIDLDRCFMKTYIDVDNGKKLVLYNTHMSAYTTNAETSTRQIEMLNNDMVEEYNKGNYIVCGGDLNREVIEGMSTYFGFESNGLNWTKTFPKEKLDSHLNLVPPVDLKNPVPTVRDTKKPWDKTNFVTVIDGFIVSDNVTVESASVIDNDFMWSDHNPISMKFMLK
ncbi:MAG: hypothetical protein KBS64_00010 [Treponema sp.]|nr:hypothetical protein [Candidatus Treponema equi]